MRNLLRFETTTKQAPEGFARVAKRKGRLLSEAAPAF